MTYDVLDAQAAVGAAVLLHPHPDYGGNRRHPFIDGMFRRLREVSVSTVRFDFSSSTPASAHTEVIAALDEAESRWPGLAVALVGYSFGAGIAASVVDARVAGWYLLAPPTDGLDHAPAGVDPRPKRIMVPELDQYFPPDAAEQALSLWTHAARHVLPGADHFLGSVSPVLDDAVGFVRELFNAPFDAL